MKPWLRPLGFAPCFVLYTCLGGAQPASTATLTSPPEKPSAGVPREEGGVAVVDSATTETTGAAVRGDRFQRARRAAPAPPGKVWPTAAGGLGGATSATQAMPTDVEGLIRMRRPFTNRPEFRGAWVTRFDWAGRRGEQFDAEGAKARIVELMEDARKLGLNAVLFQVRGDATTLYPSKLEPWSQLVGGKDPGFDPLQLAIDEAHKRGLELHAYINPVPCTEERTTEPASRDHVWYKHCLPDSSPNWLVFKEGKPAAFNEYRWFNPNLPEVQTYIRTVVMDLVTRYDIDGVHFDRIRFPSSDVSDDPWSKARFEGSANPHGKTYNEWQAESITRMLTDIYGAIMEVKPKLKVSAAVWGIYDHTVLPQGEDRATGYSWTSSGLQDYMQDSVGWINRGCMDALVPMIYWSMGDEKPDYDELLESFVTSIHNGRHVYGGQSVFSPEEMLRQVVATNLLGGQGTVPFTLNRIRRDDMAGFYARNIYPSPAPVPEMPWKTKPVFGHLIVTVKNAKGEPVTDAHVTVQGRKDVALSATDGSCAVLDLVPGEVTVQAAGKTGAGNVSGRAIVETGKVARVELTLPGQ